MFSPTDPDEFDDLPAEAIARAERLLDVAPHLGIDLDLLALVGRHLRRVERDYDAMTDPEQRAALEGQMEEDILALAEAIKAMRAAVGRGGEG